MKAILEIAIFAVLCAPLLACSPKPTESQSEPAKLPEKIAPNDTITLGPTQLIDKAIAAAGGIEKLKAADTWKSRSKGQYMGMQFESENSYKPGLMRMDFKIPGEDDMKMVMGSDQCWMTSGPVVVKCNDDEKKNNEPMLEMERAMHLWPLKEDKGWTVESSTEEVDGKRHPKLLVQKPTSGASGELLFDALNHLLIKAKYQGFMMGQPGEYISEFSGHTRYCDVMVPSKVSTSFQGQPLLTEETLALTCQPIDNAVFNAPAQVKDRTILEHSVAPATLACNVHLGPYDIIGDSIGQLMRAINKDRLNPLSSPLMIYNKGPADVKSPSDYVTEICVSVPLPPPATPDQKVGYQVRAMSGARVLAVYGIGEYSKKSPELVQLLIDEVEKRKLKTEGPVRQISYFDPITTPSDELVSEVHIPIKQ